MKEIEQFFIDDECGEFGANSRAYPYRVIAPTSDEADILFATKWGCLFYALDVCGPPENLGLIFRYGLPSAHDLPSLRSIIDNRRVLFLGDLDPTDLLIFVWFRANLHPTQFSHVGVNDRLLNELNVTIPDSYTIALSSEESEAVALLERVAPDAEGFLGAKSLELLRSGRKIEQEAIMTVLGSQEPILKYAADWASDRPATASPPACPE